LLRHQQSYISPSSSATSRSDRDPGPKIHATAPVAMPPPVQHETIDNHRKYSSDYDQEIIKPANSFFAAIANAREDDVTSDGSIIFTPQQQQLSPSVHWTSLTDNRERFPSFDSVNSTGSVRLVSPSRSSLPAPQPLPEPATPLLLPYHERRKLKQKRAPNKAQQQQRIMQQPYPMAAPDPYAQAMAIQQQHQTGMQPYPAMQMQPYPTHPPPQMGAYPPPAGHLMYAPPPQQHQQPPPQQHQQLPRGAQKLPVSRAKLQQQFPPPPSVPRPPPQSYGQQSSHHHQQQSRSRGTIPRRERSYSPDCNTDSTDSFGARPTGQQHRLKDPPSPPPPPPPPPPPVPPPVHARSDSVSSLGSVDSVDDPSARSTVRLSNAERGRPFQRLPSWSGGPTLEPKTMTELHRRNQADFHRKNQEFLSRVDRQNSHYSSPIITTTAKSTFRNNSPKQTQMRYVQC
jgi:hypothetical protein